MVQNEVSHQAPNIATDCLRNVETTKRQHCHRDSRCKEVVETLNVMDHEASLDGLRMAVTYMASMAAVGCRNDLGHLDCESEVNDAVHAECDGAVADRRDDNDCTTDWGLNASATHTHTHIQKTD